jgi:DNA-binding response OmpR family regulator
LCALPQDALVVSIAADQKALKDIENKILQMLASASGNILDDEELIETLGELVHPKGTSAMPIHLCVYTIVDEQKPV